MAGCLACALHAAHAIAVQTVGFFRRRHCRWRCHVPPISAIAGLRIQMMPNALGHPRGVLNFDAGESATYLPNQVGVALQLRTAAVRQAASMPRLYLIQPPARCCPRV